MLKIIPRRAGLDLFLVNKMKDMQDGHLWTDENQISRITKDNHWHYFIDCIEECCKLKSNLCNDKCIWNK